MMRILAVALAAGTLLGVGQASAAEDSAALAPTPPPSAAPAASMPPASMPPSASPAASVPAASESRGRVQTRHRQDRQDDQKFCLHGGISSCWIEVPTDVEGIV